MISLAQVQWQHLLQGEDDGKGGEQDHGQQAVAQHAGHTAEGHAGDAHQVQQAEHAQAADGADPVHVPKLDLASLQGHGGQQGSEGGQDGTSTGWDHHRMGPAQGADVPTLEHSKGGHRHCPPAPAPSLPSHRECFPPRVPGHLMLQEAGIPPDSVDLNEQVLI